MKFDFISEVALCLGLRADPIPFHGFAIDSRKVDKGNVFVALEGRKVDGHLFLQEAARKGAVAAIVKESYTGCDSGLLLLRVEDPVKALQELARLIHRKRKQRVIAITGSVGKTTSKEFLATVLAEKYSVAKTLGNQNSQVGLPLSILNLEGDTEFLVVEMGISEPGGLQTLMEMVPPEIALVTRIGLGHVGFFPGGVEQIAAEKLKLITYPSTRLAIIHQGSVHFKAFKEIETPLTVKTFHGEAAADYSWDGKTGIKEGTMGCFNLFPPFSVPHLWEDLVGVVAVARAVSLSWDEIARGSHKLKPPPLRFERVDKGGITFINDCYNANPESMRAALKGLPKPEPGGKTVAVLGEMVELGVYSQDAHRQVGEWARGRVDYLLCYGREASGFIEGFKENKKPWEWFQNMETLIQRVSQIVKKGDVVLIKGSNSLQLWNILAAI